ncbi:MAG: hypothetical protein F9K32_03665 [Desulfobulbaceae bacterium]|nr:MAG: hypothetical protein F9K32_03665 [Desulfobulbaceae bacterium]
MDQIFQNIVPVLGGFSIDLTTVLAGIVFLWMLVLGLDLIRMMIGGRIMSTRLGRAADYWEEQARSVRMGRDSWSRDSFEWEEQDRIYRKLLNRSADLRVRGWKD